MKILALSLLVLLSLSLQAETIKIGYIDTEQVINNISQYQQNVDELSREFEPKKKRITRFI